jgi:hypothetical protein
LAVRILSEREKKRCGAAKEKTEEEEGHYIVNL